MTMPSRRRLWPGSSRFLSVRPLAGRFLSGALLGFAALTALAWRTAFAAAPVDEPIWVSRPAADPARMQDMVRWLVRNPDNSLRSRYTYRTEMTSLGDELVERLRAALGPAGGRGTVSKWPFASKPPQWDTTGVIPSRTTLYNLIGTLEGQPGRDGIFLVTAHYDAIGARTSGWRGWDQVAPGGDDNGSGVAAVLETARLAALDEPYPFRVQFMLFDGEELGLLGSQDLADSLGRAGTPVLGVLNMDMVGYNPRADSLVVMTNRASSLLANYLRATEALAPQRNFSLAQEFSNLTAYSDHRPFWDNGYPAILLIENVNIVAHNPNYHKLSDDDAYLSRGGAMMARAANVCLRSLRRLAVTAQGPPRIHIIDDAIQLYVNRITEGRVAQPGDTLRVLASFMNEGATLPAGESRLARFFRVRGGVPEETHVARLDGPIRTGERVRADWSVIVGAEDIGAFTVEVAVEDSSFPVTARRSFPIRGQALQVMQHYMAPNPVRDPARAHLVYELTVRASARVTLYTLVGDPLGSRDYPAGAGGGAGPNGAAVGENRIPLTDLLGGTRLAPGPYLYRIEVFPDGSDQSVSSQGRFVVLR